MGAGARPKNVSYMTDAILDTELSGLDGHGLHWLQYYCEHLESGKVDGKVIPKVKRISPVAFSVDAKHGFAHPAIEKGFEKLIPAAKKFGIASLGIFNSYNAATLGYHTGYLARHGLLGLGFTNATPSIAPVGGRKPVIGTNPMSLAVPGKSGKISFLIDQSSSSVAWTNVKRAAEQGKSIPIGWALDKDGNPTDDPVKGLEGSMAPFGGETGFGQGMIVETMCAALAGGMLGPDMGSFSDNDGKPIDCGQFFIAIEPKMFSGGSFAKQIRPSPTLSRLKRDLGCLIPAAKPTSKSFPRTDFAVDRKLIERLKSFENKK